MVKKDLWEKVSSKLRICEEASHKMKWFGGKSVQAEGLAQRP